jgi:hypothetical protein
MVEALDGVLEDNPSDATSLMANEMLSQLDKINQDILLCSSDFDAAIRYVNGLVPDANVNGSLSSGLQAVLSNLYTLSADLKSFSSYGYNTVYHGNLVSNSTFGPTCFRLFSGFYNSLNLVDGES